MEDDLAVELSAGVLNSLEDRRRRDNNNDNDDKGLRSCDSDTDVSSFEFDGSNSASDEDNNVASNNKVSLAKHVMRKEDTSSFSRVSFPAENSPDNKEGREDEERIETKNRISSLDDTRKGRCLKWIYLVFRHPASRNALPIVVLALNFLIFNEDPISYSNQESKVYILGRVWNYFFRQYPPTDEGLWITLKVFSLVLWVVLGMLLGKYLVHDALLRDLLELNLFRKDMGSWPVMTLTAMTVTFGGSFVYNAIVSNYFHPVDGSDNSPYVLNDYVGIKEFQSGIVAATLCWLCDYFTLFVINDSMLQDAFSIEKRRTKYGCSHPVMVRMQTFWNDHRKLIFYMTTFLTFTGTFFYVGSNYKYGWMMKNKGHFYWNQYGRSFLTSFIIALDVCMFMQDWDFPKFKRGGKNVKILGCNDKCGFRSRKYSFKLEFNGKWINFGALFFLILLDVNLFFNQALYAPSDYLQLSDENSAVRNVYNEISYYNSTSLMLAVHFYASLLDDPGKFTYNFTRINETSPSLYVHCYNETVSFKANGTAPENEHWHYKCYNVSEPFKIEFVDPNNALSFLSAVPIAFVFILCCAVGSFVYYNNGGRCTIRTICNRGRSPGSISVA